MDLQDSRPKTARICGVRLEEVGPFGVVFEGLGIERVALGV